ncbi:MAG: bifunctional homocysteine S-methyltransferase/methylenetetrahydrofolate reductase [Verrucomicrobia bacterium]|nr:bifunctional homocysteine S-methyltransferase/methylenetetrahydrofolate reductase [Verrucomicrobiota bacterium]
MNNFLDRLQDEVLLGDGAIGTLIYQRGVPLELSFDGLNVTNPALVEQIHRDYIAAGAQVIETNTFGANRLKLAKFGLESKVNEINWKGASLAKRIAKAAGRDVYVAGSVGALGSVADEAGLTESDRRAIYQEQIGALLGGDVDVILLETFTRLGELKLALEVYQGLETRPVIASMSFDESGRSGDGVTAADCLRQLREAGADIVGFNCQLGPNVALRILERVPVEEGALLSVYPNAGKPEYFEGRYIYFGAPEYFAKMTPLLVEQGARLIGGCCGTTPETIAAMARVVSSLRPVRAKSVTVVAPREAAPPTPPAAPRESILDIIKKRTLIVTELDPPRTLPAVEKIIKGAEALKDAGTDSVTLADNSLAILRVSNVVLAQRMAERGVLPLVHLACRDRNLLGIQSELMGMSVLGLNHVLAITGDPAKSGDQPEASSVYDLNSVSLIALMKKMNEGFSHSGRDLKQRTDFIIGCSFNPNAKDINVQVKRLERKLAAGARYVMTQPVFDPALVKATHDATKHFGVPVLVGVMPLISERNCEFLHNEVPGIAIADSIRARMRGKEGDAGRREGLAIARELCDAVLALFNGIYLITPLVAYELTVELSRYVREQEKAGRRAYSVGSR